MRADYQRGVHSPDTLAWTEGMPDWQPLSAVFGPLAAPPLPATGVEAARVYDTSAYNRPFKAVAYTFAHFSFRGRATRMEYWMTALGLYIVLLPALLALDLLSGRVFSEELCGNLGQLFYLAVCVCSWPVNVRRLHDVGMSGWTLLIGLIPLLGYFIVLYLDCKDSDRGANQYGPSVKYPD